MRTMTTLRALIAAGVLLASFSVAVAKLPPPPPMDEKAKAAAAEKKAQAAAAAQAEKEALARAEDRVVARYIADQKAKGITVHAMPVVAPPNPGSAPASGSTPAPAKANTPVISAPAPK